MTATATAALDWRHRAACLDEDPELFFPVGTSQTAQDQTARAQAVCDRCPVRSQCLAWALDTGQDTGIWGGRTETERRELRRRRRPPKIRDQPPAAPPPRKTNEQDDGSRKTCDRCRARKSRSEFNRNPRNPDGLTANCIRCLARRPSRGQR